MRELHVVGLTPDGRHLLLAGTGDAAKASHRVAVDARFEAALRGMRPEDPTPMPVLTPRDIQARLRAGASVEQVAAEAGLPVSRVERFAGPVMSERDDLLRKVFSAYQTGRRGTSTVALQQAVADALAEQSFARPETLAWTAYRRPDGGWVARVSITIRGRARAAEWSLAEDGRTVRPLDAWASSLGQVDTVQRPAKRAPAKAAKPSPAKAVKPSRAKAASTAKPAPAKAAKPAPAKAAPAVRAGRPSR